MKKDQAAEYLEWFVHKTSAQTIAYALRHPDRKPNMLVLGYDIRDKLIDCLFVLELSDAYSQRTTFMDLDIVVLDTPGILDVTYLVPEDER